MTKPHVYTPNDANPVGTNLESWGELIPVFSGYVYPDTFGEIEAFAKEARLMLSGFDADADKIALIGDPALQALLIMTLVHCHCLTKISVLKYDKRLSAYYPVQLKV